MQYTTDEIQTDNCKQGGERNTWTEDGRNSKKLTIAK
jgi:hypothetical protein